MKKEKWFPQGDESLEPLVWAREFTDSGKEKGVSLCRSRVWKSKFYRSDIGHREFSSELEAE